jgi:hypothetical protein
MNAKERDRRGDAGGKRDTAATSLAIPGRRPRTHFVAADYLLRQIATARGQLGHLRPEESPDKLELDRQHAELRATHGAAQAAHPPDKGTAGHTADVLMTPVRLVAAVLGGGAEYGKTVTDATVLGAAALVPRCVRTTQQRGIACHIES